MKLLLTFALVCLATAAAFPSMTAIDASKKLRDAHKQSLELMQGHLMKAHQAVGRMAASANVDYLLDGLQQDNKKGKMTTQSTACNNTLAAIQGNSTITACLNQFSTFFSGASASTLDTFCTGGASSCDAILNQTLHNLAAVCTDSVDLANSNLRNRINQINTVRKVACIKRSGEYCLVKYQAYISNVGTTNPNQSQLAQYCDDCIDIVVNSLFGNGASSLFGALLAFTAEFRRLFCIKDGNVFCFEYFEGLTTQSSNNVNDIFEYICANRCFKLVADGFERLGNSGITGAQAFSAIGQIYRVFTNCERKQDGTLCSTTTFTSVFIANFTGALSACPGTITSGSSCSIGCATALTALTSGFDCCVRSGIDTLAYMQALATFNFNTQATAPVILDFFTNKCGLTAPPRCRLSSVTINVVLANLRYSYVASNLAAIRQALINDCADFFDVDAGDITVPSLTQVSSSGGSSRFSTQNTGEVATQIKIDAGSRREADSIAAQANTANTNSDFSMPNINQLPLEARLDPVAPTAPAASGFSTGVQSSQQSPANVIHPAFNVLMSLLVAFLLASSLTQ